MKSEFLKDLEAAIKSVMDKHMTGEDIEYQGLLLVSADLRDESGDNVFGVTKGYSDVISQTLLVAMNSDQDLADVVIEASAEYAYERISKRPDPTILN